jgi:threonine dehydrogenase-like Zn-dependent dehydrogenase
MADVPFVYKLVAPESLIVEFDEDLISPPDADQILTKTVVSAISPGTELSAWRGDPPLRPTKNIYPRLMGYCNVAQVTHVGSDVDNFTSGDLVLTHSSHRSHDKISASEVLCKVPQGADPVLASTSYLFHLGYSACLKAKVKAGHNVAVVGLGTLGLTSAAAANLAGAIVDGYSNQKLPPEAFMLSEMHSKKNVRKLDYADVVITTSNSWPDWSLALELARPGGTVAVLGFPGRGHTIVDQNPLDSKHFYDKQLTITACGYMPNLSVSPQNIRFTLKRNCTYLLKKILDGRLPAQAIIQDIIDARELQRLYTEMTVNRKGSGTFVLDWTGI